MTTQARLQAVREAMRHHRLQAWIIFTGDPHLCEYPPAHWTARAWVSGFNGSAGTLVVTRTGAALWTDSRYWVSASADLKGSGITLMRQGEEGCPTMAEWLASELEEGELVGFDSQFLSLAQFEKLTQELEAVELIPCITDDIMDEVWTENRPPKPLSEVFALEDAGLTRAEKLEKMREHMRSKNATAWLFSALDDIAWLLNLRASDVAHCPVFVADLIVDDYGAELFIETRRVPSAIQKALRADGITLSLPDRFIPSLDNRLFAGDTIGYDAERTNAYVATIVSQNGVNTLSPAAALKSIKHPEELAKIRQAMVADGVALSEFYAELEERLNNGETLTEMDCVERLHFWRAQHPDFLEESFGTIAAFGEHAALPHYSPSKETDVPLTRGLLLIDSGGQYRTGTTDITRMTAVGKLTEEERNDVTYVLKAHLALARAGAPIGASGATLDAICRKPLWYRKRDFGHGTGHGVGFVGNVHEGPFHISPRAHATGPLGIQPGRVVSNEPGVYKPGRHGVRIENLIVAHAHDESEFGHFIRFETLSLCPIDTATYNPYLLNDMERYWLCRYHRNVYEALKDHVSDRARAWLARFAEPDEQLIARMENNQELAESLN